MHKFYIVSVFALLINLSATMASTRDSIGVENHNGKKLIVHQVVAKDTYYSIGRRYQVTPKEIMAFNDSKFLQIGVIIKVPTNRPFINNPAAGKVDQAVSTVKSNDHFIEHIVQKKENLNRLAEKYDTTVEDIKRANNLTSINLRIGQALKIPSKSGNPVPIEDIQTTATRQKVVETVVKTNIPPENRHTKKDKVAEKVAPVENRQEQFILHTVASNETMYSIASRYKMTMDQLKAKNNLTDNSLHVGQKLLISGQYPKRNVYTPAPNNDSINSITDPDLRYPASKYGLNQVDEKGAGVWIADADLDPSKMLVLHRTAPIGTVMKITNPMTNRSTFAKVVGKFTENESTKDVIIVMTKAVSDALGVLDKRFYCNLTYGGQDHE